MLETDYKLPITVKNIILSLDKLFYTTTNGIKIESRKEYGITRDKPRKNKKNVEDTSNISWETGKIESKVDYGKEKNEINLQTEYELGSDNIRIALNKISDKNYDHQKVIILTHLIVFEKDPNEMTKIAQFILETVSSNKFYNQLYADLYEELIKKYAIFLELLNTMVNEFKTSIDTIRIIDANIDYNGFCDCVKENDKRRSISVFLMILCNRKIISKRLIISIIHNFQLSVIENIEKEKKSSYVEEVTELLFIFISMGHENNLFMKKKCWTECIIPNVFLIGKMKSNESLSLSSRSIFKHLDLIDLLNIKPSKGK